MDNPAQTPQIYLTVCPKGSGNKVESMEIRYSLQGHSRDTGEELFHINLETVTIPFCPMSDLVAYDKAGELKLEEETETVYPVTYKRWRVGRKTEGEVCFKYSITPRILPEEYRSSPYYDFRNEEGGANGAGITFLAEVTGSEQFEVSFDWDLSMMPSGSKGVSTYSEGRFEKTGKASLVTNAYYAVGQVRSITDGDFGFYWLSEPPFDLKSVAEWTKCLFLRMADFFNDDNGLYRIFVRKDPFEKSGGGTALIRSYMFGYSEAMIPTLDSLKNLLAHEMVHNWPHMTDEPYGSGTWYLEGTAEYYSVMLPYRFGMATVEETLEQVQKRSDQYFLSPVRHLSNAEAAAQSWTDRRTQRIPYGRGFFFLASLDARIRRHTAGEKSLDDIVLTLVKKWDREQKCSNEDFLRLYSQLTGGDLSDEFSKMAEGQPITPDPDSFDGLFDRVEADRKENDTGNPVRAWKWSIR